MPRASRLAWLAVVFLAACGSATPLPAADYFPAVEAELVRLDQATRDLTDRFASELEAKLEELVGATDLSVPGASDRVLQDIVAATKVNMQAIIEAHTGQVVVFTDRVDALVPPRAVAGGHEELLAAFTAWAASGPQTIALLGAASDVAELAANLSASPFADARLRVDQACQALVPNAVAAGVELTCPGAGVDVLDVRAPVPTRPAATSTTLPPQTPTAGACPVVLGAELTKTAPGVFTVSVTVSSVDIEGVSYADRWEVRSPVGDVLGTRLLTHPHADEQPFTRSLGGVEIPPSVTEVVIEAGDSVAGFCGEPLTVAVPGG